MNAAAVRFVHRPAIPSWRELALPLLLTAWVQVDVWGSPPVAFGHMVGPRAVIALLYAVTSLALVWRADAPLAVLAFIVAADSAEYLAFGAPEGLGSFLPLLIAFFCVGRYMRANALIVAGPLVAVGMSVHETNDPTFAFGGSTAFFWLVLACAWPLGQAFRGRAVENAALAGQARRLAEERAELARAAVQDERARIARELHDVVGHGLSVVVLQLVGALGLLDREDSAAARTRVATAERSARDALAEMRRLLDLLDDGEGASLLPQPGLAQLDGLLSDTRSAGATVDLTVAGTPRQLPTGVDLAAFRIVQESLTNLLKHARPPVAHVRVDYTPDAVTVEVRDEGRVRGADGPGGRGLTGMRERVALYGGELEVGPCPDGGYRVQARLPVVA